MTDLEKFLVICLGLLVAALPFAALIAIDGWRIRRWWGRTLHYWTVRIHQATDEEREAAALVAALTFIYGFMLLRF